MRLLVSVLLLLLCGVAEAAARQVALVVGIARYERLPQLPNPGRDAAAIADRLRDQGFEVIEAFDADRFALDRARRRFLAEARGADLALFYFAGHGVQLFDRNVLLVRDADPASAVAIDDLGLDLTALMTDLRAAGPVRTAFLIDACRDNPLSFDDTVALLRRIEQRAGTSLPGASAAPPTGTRGLSVVALPTRGTGAAETLALFAAQPGQVSFDGDGRNSFFVEGLLEAFAKADRPFGEVLRSASAYVRTVTNGAQVPQLVSDWTSDIVLGRATAAVVRYLGVSRATGDAPLSAEEVRIVGEAKRSQKVLSGTFIVAASQSFTDNWLEAEDAEKARAAAIGFVNGFAIDYDIDRDGRPETIAAYVRQTNAIIEVVDEGVSRLDAPCYEFDSTQVEAMEIALRDINGDRRPEIFLHYQTEPGNWGTLCILEYVGPRDLSASRRAAQGASTAGEGMFRVLLRHDGAWTVSVGADNGLELCAGSNCHTRSAYTFDGTHFRMTFDESDQPEAGKASPFRDQAERDRLIKANPGRKAAAVAPPPTPPPAPATNLAPPSLAAVTRYIAETYLPAGTDGRPAQLSYEPTVLYYGKPTPRASIVADKQRYATRWPRRAYRLEPGTVRLSQGTAGRLEVTFDYVFEVADGKRTVGGVGRTRLDLRPSGTSFVIAREEGEVLRRR